MPRRKAQPHPDLIGGSPEHGEPFPLDDEAAAYGHPTEPQGDDEDDGGDEYANNPPPQGRKDRFAEMEAELARLRSENDLIKKAIPPREPARAEPAEPEAPDWDELLFSDPKEALRLHGEMVADKVTRQLRNEYTTNQGTEKFWNEFYKEHDDLVEDKELVQFILSTKFDEIGGMPVEQAKKTLADLTRTQIMGYARRSGQGRRGRAVVEGATPPSPPPKARQNAEGANNVTTLGDVIRARRAKRRAATAA